MNTIPIHHEDFSETLDALIEDVILLDALHAFRSEDCTPLLSPLHHKFSDQTQRRILDYLDQHASDLYRITRYTEKAQDT